MLDAAHAHKKTSFDAILRSCKAFARLPDNALVKLTNLGGLVRLEVSETFSRNEPETREEYYHYVLDGKLSVVSTLDDNPNQDKPARKSAITQTDYVTYLSEGDCFSDAYLDKHTRNPDCWVDCIASMRTTLYRISRSNLSKFLLDYPEWSRDQEHQNRLLRNHFQSQQIPTRRMVQDFYLRHNLFLASKLRVVQLDMCLNCESCLKACTKRHGFARFSRNGLQLGKLLFPSGCNNCNQPRCIDACSFSAISKDETTGRIIISRRCIGCGECAKACPFNGITLIEVPYTVEDFETPLPQSNRSGKTNLPGLYVAGDVAGECLIKPSIIAGKRAVISIQKNHNSNTAKSDLDVIIIGAGPAGLSAALECKDQGLRYIVIEKDKFASTIRSYPNGKHIMAEPANLPTQSRLWFQDTTKKELLEKWQQIVDSNKLELVENNAVMKIMKAPDNSFQVFTKQGDYCASNVIITIGTQGSPRKAGIEDECEPRFLYDLQDPEIHSGKHILVIGGGDSAIETACSLADVHNTKVTLSYRRDQFFRLKAKNKQNLYEYQDEGKIKIILGSTVTSVTDNQVSLCCGDKNHTIDNDIIFAMLGSDPPTGFLKDSGIKVLKPGSKEMAAFAEVRGTRQISSKCDGCVGYSDQACLQACPTKALVQVSPQELFLEKLHTQESERANFSGISFLEGIKERRATQNGRIGFSWFVLTTILLLAGIGVECFLRRTMPEKSLLAIWYSINQIQEQIEYGSGKGLGHWLGYIGCSLMLLTLLYPLQSRLGLFRKIIARSKFLSWHIWTGLTGATLTTYHSMLKLDRWVGISCLAMWMVILSGVIGRYLYARVHSGLGLANWEQLSLKHKHRNAERYLDLDKWKENIERKPFGLLGMLWKDCFDHLWLFRMKHFGLRHIKNPQERRDIMAFLVDWSRNQRFRVYLQQAEKLLSHWNIIHSILTAIMFTLAILHIVYGLLYKAV